MANLPRIPLPKGWPTRVKSAMLHVISLAQYAVVGGSGSGSGGGGGGGPFFAPDRRCWRVFQQVELPLGVHFPGTDHQRGQDSLISGCPQQRLLTPFDLSAVK